MSLKKLNKILDLTEQDQTSLIITTTTTKTKTWNVKLQ